MASRPVSAELMIELSGFVSGMKVGQERLFNVLCSGGNPGPAAHRCFSC